MQPKITELNDINLNIPEGRLLFSALAKITTESQRDKTPDQVIEQLNKLSDQMDLAKKRDLIDIRSIHDKSLPAAEMEERFCLIKTDSLEHLLNCLDNQKFNHFGATQVAIDKTNRAAREQLHEVLNWNKPKTGAQ